MQSRTYEGYRQQRLGNRGSNKRCDAKPIQSRQSRYTCATRCTRHPNYPGPFTRGGMRHTQTSGVLTDNVSRVKTQCGFASGCLHEAMRQRLSSTHGWDGSANRGGSRAPVQTDSSDGSNGCSQQIQPGSGSPRPGCLHRDAHIWVAT